MLFKSLPMTLFRIPQISKYNMLANKADNTAGIFNPITELMHCANNDKT